MNYCNVLKRSRFSLLFFFCGAFERYIVKVNIYIKCLRHCLMQKGLVMHNNTLLLNPHTNLLEQDPYSYQLQDVEKPELFREFKLSVEV